MEAIHDGRDVPERLGVPEDLHEVGLYGLKVHEGLREFTAEIGLDDAWIICPS